MNELEIVEGDFGRDPETIPSREPSDCSALESQLHQLTQTDDPPLVADQLATDVPQGIRARQEADVDMD
ncbi:MAG: hypothetical protein U9R72_14615 [Chloroflexota bacterium]|nr:hypothetical protein [Chloroflexota bacterium]